MLLIDAFDFVAGLRPAWKGKAGWNPPFSFNRAHALRLLGPNKDVRKITKADLAKMRATLMEEPGKKGRRTPGGVNRIMSLILTLLNELEDNEIIDKAPKLRGLPENNMRTAYFDRPQIEKMITISKAQGNDLLGDAILFGVYTGCRQSELLSLTVGDVDFRHNLVTFRDTKNGTDHTLDIHTELYDMLKDRCEGKPKAAPVFDFNNDDQLRDAFYKVRDEAGIGSDHVWHTLRHTTGTWLAEKGVPLQTIAKVLNHKNVMTSARYTKVTDKARRDAVNLL